MWTAIANHITQVTALPFTIVQRRSVSGGCINQGYCLRGEELAYFVKINAAAQVSMFEAEALGLKEMLATGTIRLPHPICWGTSEGSSYLVLEWLEFGRPQAHSWEKMGENLAKMHRAAGSAQFGWQQNNTIGSTPQINTWSDNWADFFTQYRLGYQLQLAHKRGSNFPDSEAILAAVHDRLEAYNPQPSLVHGDLWSGNVAVTVSGEPVILDPATYYGDREVDLAMTELFGGFPAAFYRGYDTISPIEEGYQQRKTIYNLYHVLNHFNLFGGGYGLQAHQMLRQIL